MRYLLDRVMRAVFSVEVFFKVVEVIEVIERHCDEGIILKMSLTTHITQLKTQNTAKPVEKARIVPGGATSKHIGRHLHAYRKKPTFDPFGHRPPMLGPAKGTGSEKAFSCRRTWVDEIAL